jgi:hypothetical protein
MTEDEFRWHVVGSLVRIADALERAAPVKVEQAKPKLTRMDLDNLTTMTHDHRKKLEAEWQAADKQKRFENPSL